MALLVRLNQSNQLPQGVMPQCLLINRQLITTRQSHPFLIAVTRNGQSRQPNATGISRSEAIRKMGQRIDDLSIKSLTSSIVQAEKMGMNLGPILRAQAEQRRIERFLKAEKLAMEAPVKLLFPLVAFIFPCTFIVIGFPVYVMMKEAFG